MEQRIDLYRMGCLAVGVLGLLLLTRGLQQILTMMFLWRDSSQALVVFAYLSGLLPGAAIIYYRRQITARWLLPDATSSSSESVGAFPTRALAVSLLGIYLAAGGVTSLASGLARVLFFPGDFPRDHFFSSLGAQTLGPAVGLSIGLGLLFKARQIEKLL